MTPALLASFRLPGTPAAPGAPPLAVTWHGRDLFTREHVDMLLDSLGAGVTLADALRSALGPTLPHAGLGRRVHDAADARAALTAACTACRELERAVDAAIAEGRAAGRAAAAMVGTIKVEEKVTPKAHARPVETLDRFAEAKAASAAREAAERPVERGDCENVEIVDRVARECAAFDQKSPNMGRLLWVEQHRVKAGLHPLDPQWIWHFGEFYGSGKFIDLGRWGVRAAKSDSCCAALVAEVRLMPRRLEPSIVGVCPIMSSTTREAGDRFDTLKANLRAIGMSDITGTRADVGLHSFKTSGGGSAPLLIELQDITGHPVEFRIYAASENVAGCTAIAGFGDELDLWGKAGGANPAEKVVEVFVTRFTTVPQAKLHLMSATYDRDSYHAKMIRNGDTPRQRVARLGQAGAMKDAAERARLAMLIASDDPLLLAPADPMSTDIPCWVSNPITPIEECYTKMDGDLRRMFAKYGGRPDYAAGKTTNAAEQLRWIAEINDRLARDDRTQHSPGVPGTDPREERRDYGAVSRPFERKAAM